MDTVSIRALVGQLDLERYKATIKGLTQFGDRRQGTARNRAAIDWIETQLNHLQLPGRHNTNALGGPAVEASYDSSRWRENSRQCSANRRQQRFACAA
jgi:hypothetical protein